MKLKRKEEESCNGRTRYTDLTSQSSVSKGTIQGKTGDVVCLLWLAFICLLFETSV